jgi:hypothetical protein
MSVNSESLRLPLIYTAIMIMAAVLGSALAMGAEVDTIVLVAALAGILAIPLVLKWHRAMLFFSWNSTLGAYFLVGASPLWISMTVLSLVFSMAEWAMLREKRFIPVPVIVWPLAVFAGVVVVTMMATGGLGIQWMGSGVLSGGRKYVYVLGACLGFFSLMGAAIPVEKAPLYYGLFFLGGLTGFVGPLAGWLGGPLGNLQYIFAPIEGVALSDTGFRVKGLSFTGSAIVAWMLARHGWSGIFRADRAWRIGILGLGIFLGMLSGYRTTLAIFAVTLVILFFLEGQHRTPQALAWLGGGLLALTLLIPLTPYLPTPLQRSLAFLPLPVDAAVKFDATSTMQWREGLFTALVADVPEYFWLGKGMTISTVDMEWAETIGRFGADKWYLSYLTGEHHNGFLSVIISFGVWGVLAFFWLLGAGLWVLNRNYRYGRTELRTVNAYLLVSCVVWSLGFFSYAGTLYWMMKDLTGMLALSVALNGGVASLTESATPGWSPTSLGGQDQTSASAATS